MGTYLAMFVTAVLAAAQMAQPATTANAASAGSLTFASAATRATNTLLHTYYTGSGRWRACDRSSCPTGDTDWGDDSLTAVLALRDARGHQSSLVPVLDALAHNARSYPAPCTNVSTCKSLSDEPEWDAVALAEEYSITHDRVALSKAEAAYHFVAGASVYNIGYCPNMPYQKPGGGGTNVKTLETEGNLIKAALLLYHETKNSSYLGQAIAGYQGARAYFLDSRVSLYTTYLFDDGYSCRQLSHRFFASVNGIMISDGLQLYEDTGEPAYLQDAKATAAAVSRYLSDGRGVFADLQAENDVVEPLVEGMYALAQNGDSAARNWLLSNAAAALSARTSDGSFGRFFDGPPPRTSVTAWQTNGGLAIEVAASALAPNQRVQKTQAWRRQRTVSHQISKLPASLHFRGSGIALIGTLGEQCCSAGHARVFVDGKETFDHTGIWQNKSSINSSIPNTIMFVWRWPKAGRHTLRFLPGVKNAKEGGSFLHLTRYELIG